MSLQTSTLMAASIAVPAIGSVAVYAAGKSPVLRNLLSLTTAILLLVITLYIARSGAGTLHLGTVLPGIDIAFRLEPLGILFAIVASCLWLVNSVYTIGYLNKTEGAFGTGQRIFYACFPFALASTMGIAYADNLFTLFVFYELLTFSTYPLVVHKRNEAAMQGGRTYLGWLVGASLGPLLLAILLTWLEAGTMTFQIGGIFSESSKVLIGLLLFLFIYGLGKAALMPLHRWLPAAMVAPTPVSAVLHAVAVVKAGVFCVLKIVAYVFGPATLNLAEADWLLYMAGFTIVAASVVALNADNIKRRLAYSTIGQLAYITLAAALFAPLGLIAGAMHILAHAVSKITLFYAAGNIYAASGKTEVSQLDGIGRAMPWTMTAFSIGAISLIGLPPTIGFVSKWWLLSGAATAELSSFQQYFVFIVITVSSLLNAAYFLPIIYRAFAKPLPAESKPHGEAPKLMVIAISLTAMTVITLFFCHQWAYDLAAAMVEPLTAKGV